MPPWKSHWCWSERLQTNYYFSKSLSEKRERFKGAGMSHFCRQIHQSTAVCRDWGKRGVKPILPMLGILILLKVHTQKVLQSANLESFAKCKPGKFCQLHTWKVLQSAYLESFAKCIPGKFCQLHTWKVLQSANLESFAGKFCKVQTWRPIIGQLETSPNDQQGDNHLVCQIVE